MAGNRRWKRLVGLLFVLFIWGVSAVLAAVPAEINYQGSIEDLSGPVDGTLDLTFRLFDADVAGTIVWEEANSVLVNQGIYNIILGTGTLNPSYGSLEEAIFENDDLWLEVQVAGEADALAPRQKITSVGFAMRAGSVSDGTITATMLADDAVTTDKLVDGAVTADKVTGGFVPNLDADRLDGHDTTYFAPATTVSALQSQVAALQSQVDSLVALLANVSRPDSNTLRFANVNVQIVNGTGTTAGTSNGLGNLIVGYNENTVSASRTGSHNLVIGIDHAYTSYAGFLAGRQNTINGTSSSVMGYGNEVTASYSSISGGANNIASSIYSSVNGGYANSVSAAYASVNGGRDNTASGNYSSVSGGRYNQASGSYASVSGGGGQYSYLGNQAFGDYSAIMGGLVNIAGDPDLTDHTIGEQASICGGRDNIASAYAASVSGGRYNTAGATYASVSGGYENTASGVAASVSGGYQNTATGNEASVSGGRHNQASGNFSFVGGGGGIEAFEGNRAYAHYSAVLGGHYNVAGDLSGTPDDAQFSTISGGWDNHARGQYSSVSGGNNNFAKGEESSISGGWSNDASGNGSSVSGGLNNDAIGNGSSVSGGYYNEASGNGSSVSGGESNTASGDRSSVSGGDNRSVSGFTDWRAGDCYFCTD